jgi:hypothetical protein
MWPPSGGRGFALSQRQRADSGGSPSGVRGARPGAWALRRNGHGRITWRTPASPSPTRRRGARARPCRARPTFNCDDGGQTRSVRERRERLRLDQDVGGSARRAGTLRQAQITSVRQNTPGSAQTSTSGCVAVSELEQRAGGGSGGGPVVGVGACRAARLRTSSVRFRHDSGRAGWGRGLLQLTQSGPGFGPQGPHSTGLERSPAHDRGRAHTSVLNHAAGLTFVTWEKRARR